MFNWLFGKSLESYLHETKTVKVKGIKFTIKKINALNYLDGSRALQQSFDTYKTKSDASAVMSDKKVADYFENVLCGCVVHPRLVHKKEDQGIFIQDLFVDWDLVVGVYNEIMLFTYGKKKMKQLASQRTS